MMAMLSYDAMCLKQRSAANELKATVMNITTHIVR